MKLKKLFPIFFEGDDGGGSGGSAADGAETPSLADVLGDEQGGEGDASQQSSSSTSTSASSESTPAFDPKALGAAFAEGIKNSGLVQPPTATPPPQMTAEQAAKLLNIPQFTDDWMKRFGNVETQKQAFEELRDGLLRSMVTVQQMREQELQRNWESQFQPIAQQFQQAQAEQRWNNFKSAYPDIGKDELKPLVGAVVDSLAKSNKLTAGDDQGNFKTIAEGVAAAIRAVNPSFKLSPGGSTPNGGQTNNGLRASSVGSGGGGGGKAADDNKGGNKSTLAKYL